VRPTPPSDAPSAFISGILREPLADKKTVCPFGASLEDPALDMPIWVGSTRSAVKNIAYARLASAERFAEHTRVVNLPGFTITVKQQLEALAKVAGKEALDFIEFAPDPDIQRIVGSWPAHFDNTYARSLGFHADKRGLESAIREHLEDDAPYSRKRYYMY